MRGHLVNQWSNGPGPLCSRPPYEFQLKQSSASPGALYLSPREGLWGPLHEGLPTAGPSGGRQFPLPSHILRSRCHCRSHVWNPCSFGQMFPQHHAGCLCVGPMGGRNNCLPQVSSPPAATMSFSKTKITHILKGEVLTPATFPLPSPSITGPIPLWFSPPSSQARGPSFAQTRASFHGPFFRTVFASL